MTFGSLDVLAMSSNTGNLGEDPLLTGVEVFGWRKGWEGESKRLVSLVLEAGFS
jgi:hypothetical protein